MNVPPSALADPVRVGLIGAGRIGTAPRALAIAPACIKSCQTHGPVSLKQPAV
jgi:hypothetical protein